MIIRIEDCRAKRLCSAGLRRFAEKHGLDFQEFVRNGIDSDLLPKNDSTVEEMIEQAKRREEAHGQG